MINDKLLKIDELRDLLAAAVALGVERSALMFLRRIYALTIEIEEIRRTMVH